MKPLTKSAEIDEPCHVAFKGAELVRSANFITGLGWPAAETPYWRILQNCSSAGKNPEHWKKTIRAQSTQPGLPVNFNDECLNKN